MKLSTDGFRAVDGHFCYFELEKDGPLWEAASAFDGADEANCVLAYGYIDSKLATGLTLEILSTAIETDDDISLIEQSDPTLTKCVPAETIWNVEFGWVPDEEYFAEKWEDRVAYRNLCQPAQAMLNTRQITLIDKVRHEQYPDLIMVALVRDDREPEYIWALCQALGPQSIFAEVYNAPKQPFGVYPHDIIEVELFKNGDEWMCVADLNERGEAN